jgi:hypothetical protein
VREARSLPTAWLVLAIAASAEALGCARG